MKFLEKFVDVYLMPLAAYMATQRYLVAIRDGFIILIPFVIVASFFVLLNNVVFDTKNGLIAFTGLAKYVAFWQAVKEIGLIIYNGTLNILTLLLTFSVSYKLASSYKEDGVIVATLSVALLVMFFPSFVNVTAVNGNIFQAQNVISTEYTAATGLFVGILIAIFGTEFFLRLNKIDALKIKMPDSVPQNVAKSFYVLLPIIIIMILTALISLTLNKFFHLTLHEIIVRFVQMPILALTQDWFGITTILFIQNLLWSLGIHGAFILMPVLEPTLLVAIQQNITSLSLGLEPLNIVTKPFLDAFGFMGGGGATMGLLLAILLASKRKDYRTIAKLAMIPSLFNINEPLIFGLPVIFNPILAIPLVLTPIITTSIAYFATYFGFISKTVVLLPWTTPPILSAFLATNGDYRAALLSFGTILVAIIIYLPFVWASNKVVKN